MENGAISAFIVDFVIMYKKKFEIYTKMAWTKWLPISPGTEERALEN